MLRIPHGMGNPSAKILFLKDMPSFDEVRHQEFFADAGGREFRKMLGEAGIQFTDVYSTSVSKSYLPGKDEERFSDKRTKYAGKIRFENTMFMQESIVRDFEILMKEIEALSPNIIVPLGPLALWLAIGETSISTWRGSLNFSPRFNRKIIPTFDPAMIIKVWNWRYQSVRDLQRVESESNRKELILPNYNFTINPTYMQAMTRLQMLVNEANRMTE